ncbi:hypothetical protein DID80_03570 [Candidatus Marinamargulisbacteria bacterium SCGC AAA071-K20]|nr:hypothetical protein DID80_03570 [Candidatus Marinamargulisbacteria bacterium SCGC AAA071-K20]
MHRYYLFLGVIFNIIFAVVHLATIFIGTPAYDFLDAPQFGKMAANGSIIPAITTLFLVLLFSLFAWYGISTAGIGRKLPGRFVILSLIGWIYALRGSAFVIFIYFYFTDSIYNNPKEIVFSLISLLAGAYYLKGRHYLMFEDLDKITAKR